MFDNQSTFYVKFKEWIIRAVHNKDEGQVKRMDDQGSL